MGVECSSCTYVGIYAGDSKDDVEEYLIAKGLLKVGELDSAYGGDIGDMYDQGFPLSVKCANLYTGEGWYLGFETDVSEYRLFDDLLTEFKNLTGEDGDVITFERWH